MHSTQLLIRNRGDFNAIKTNDGVRAMLANFVMAVDGYLILYSGALTKSTLPNTFYTNFSMQIIPNRKMIFLKQRSFEIKMYPHLQGPRQLCWCGGNEEQKTHSLASLSNKVQKKEILDSLLMFDNKKMTVQGTMERSNV